MFAYMDEKVCDYPALRSKAAHGSNPAKDHRSRALTIRCVNDLVFLARTVEGAIEPARVPTPSF